ncbi:MAG: hypothetical protein R8N23_01265 [Reichenbachiella sp.]|uniref:hypothetical protein n=1 Tax=Reichenbachiella sp. TaxID=2184521 RepID=UPI0029665C8C|nr:hypothetical protein [Reichenbachiella sp.]MDW3208466.1 hypothetical protein [Reichenbachiella sp.]
MKFFNFLIFNPFANALVNQVEKTLPLPLRAKSMMLDFARSMGIVFPIVLPLIFVVERYWSFDLGFYLLWPLLTLVMFNKDIVDGRSITKRNLGLAIVKSSSGEPASKLQCFFRNITFFAWPLEALIAFSGTGQRIGDILAGTKIVNQPKISNSTFTSELLKVHISIELILVNILVIGIGIVLQNTMMF